MILQLIGSGKLRSSEETTTPLSDREFRVFRLLGTYKGAKAIALELGVSVRTIETHQIRMKRKFHVKSCKDLQTIALQWVRSHESSTARFIESVRDH